MAPVAKRKGRPSITQSGTQHKGLILTRAEEVNMKSILVVEEDIEGRAILAKMLRLRGFQVLPVGNETAAIVALSSDRPIDLVLAGATDQDRADFLTGVRTRRPSVPVVLLADRHDAKSQAQVLPSGFSMSSRLNFYMNTRPIHFGELDRLIRFALMPRQWTRHSGTRAA